MKEQFKKINSLQRKNDKVIPNLTHALINLRSYGSDVLLKKVILARVLRPWKNGSLEKQSGCIRNLLNLGGEVNEQMEGPYFYCGRPHFGQEYYKRISESIGEGLPF